MNSKWGEFEPVFQYVANKVYPPACSKDAKRRIREKSVVFAVENGVLMHRNRQGALCRVVVNIGEREGILTALHADAVGGAHYGQCATIKKVTERFWWRNVADDVRDFVKACSVCQKANPTNKPPASTLHPLAVKDIFHRCGVDMVGPLTETRRGNKYLVVATEYLTRWPEAVAVPDKSAEGIHRFLMGLVCRYGSCHILLHDQGREFNNQLCRDLCKQLQTSQAMTSAYHPQSNG